MRYTNRIVSTALIDAKQHLMRIDSPFQTIQPLHFLLAANQPTGRSSTGILHVIQRCRILYTLVKCHCNGRAKIRLNLHAFFWTHENRLTVDMGLEINAFLSDTAKLCQREHLKSAAVCENWLVPVHKLVQSAHLTDDFISRTQMQVIGITKFYLTFQFIRQVNGRYAAFDGRSSSYIHKEGCLNGAVYGFKDASSGMSFGF